jgi:WD40 repeat protein/serine/threonine protein kinase
MPNPPDREVTAFSAAVNVPAGQRAACLDQACAGDNALRLKIEALLRAHDEAGRRQEAPADGAATLAPDGTALTHFGPVEKVGDRIGRYKLREQIGEGGCGVVYVAEQEEPVRRRVALKVIKLGMDTRSVVARFEAERQALAMMDHPNIAKVLDAGATETGRPYFVMELVRGIRITDYCDQANLPIEERLKLFTQVCQAIQHAHQKGIIHRDIKPSNILVTMHDGVPMPKVIDFGIAKAMEGRLTDLTIYTELHQFIGTPAYMSPEQAEMSALNIDTRSDIYALGVLLYELLTGHTPFDPKELLKSGLDEMRRTIREKEPQRPSTRLSTMLDADLTAIARRHGTQPPKLIHLIRGDLDWVVMKALEKDRTRRYETANGLAMDIRRHLNNEPVVACPPTNLYRFRKLVRRNRLAFVAASAVTAALVIGLGVSTWMFARERKAHQRTVLAEGEQSRLRQVAEVAGAKETQMRQLAEARAIAARRDAYASGLIAANFALKDGNLGLVRALLAQHQPQSGQEDLRGFEWRYLWGRSRGDQIRTLTGHSDYVNSVAYSPDGTILASGSSDHTVKLWNPNTGELIATCAGHAGAVTSVAFAPSGKLFVSAGTDRLVQLRDVQTHQIVLTIKDHTSCAAISDRFLALTNGGDRLDNNGGTVELWNYATSQLAATLPASGNRAAFSPDGRTLATANGQGMIRLWNVDDQRPLKSFPSEGVFSLAFSRDGSTLAWGTNSGDIGIWQLANDQPTILSKAGGRVLSVSFSPDGQTLATAHQSHEISLWDVSSGQMLRTLHGHGGEVWSVAFSPDGRSLASGSFDDTVMLWNASGTAEKDTISNVEIPQWDRVGRPVFSPDGSKLAAAAVGGGVVIWEAANGQITIKPAIEGRPTTFSPDGKSLFTRDAALKLLREWDVSTQTLLASTAITTPKDRIYDSALSPDGKLLAVSRPGRVVLNDLATGQGIFEFAQKSTARCLIFSRDGTMLVTGNWDTTASLWDLKNRQVTWTEGGFRSIVAAVASGANGVFAAGSWDGTIKIWDPSAKTDLATLVGHKSGVIQLDFSSDGRTLASGSDDWTVKLWNLAIGREVVTLKADVPQFFVKFSPDGTILATGGGDGVVHLWRAPSWAEIAIAEKTRTEN